jgi:hypothetical protein
MATTATIPTRALRTDITGLTGLPAESSSAPARGITDTGDAAAGAVAIMAAAGMGGDAVVTAMHAAATDTAAGATRDVVSQDAVRRADSMAEEQSAVVAVGSTVEAADSTVAAEVDSTVAELPTVGAADTAADTAKSIAGL